MLDNPARDTEPRVEPQAEPQADYTAALLSPEDAHAVFAFLSSAARDAMERLFTGGPTHDLSLSGLAARDELRGMGLVFEVPSGWFSLTPQGLCVAVHADVVDRKDVWWHRKQGTGKEKPQ